MPWSEGKRTLYEGVPNQTKKVINAGSTKGYIQKDPKPDTDEPLSS